MKPEHDLFDFPLAEAKDLLSMWNKKHFYPKRGVKDIIKIADFCADQLPEDAAPVDPTTIAPVPARAPADHAAAMSDLMTDLKAMVDLHEKHAHEIKSNPAKARGLFSGFDWSKLLKLLPLIISLLGQGGAGAG